MGTLVRMVLRAAKCWILRTIPNNRHSRTGFVGYAPDLTNLEFSTRRSLWIPGRIRSVGRLSVRSAKGIAMKWLNLCSQSFLTKRLASHGSGWSSLACLILLSAMLAPNLLAGERPTFNKDTCDPRPDILPYWLTSWHTEYRREYNRPRYLSGKIAHAVEPTCQEAMVWCEANQMGLYDTCKHPPVYKSYNTPKPWEILATGPRPDFKKPASPYPSSTSSDGKSSAVEVAKSEALSEGSSRTASASQSDKAPVQAAQSLYLRSAVTK